jgi:hypothetical protein
MLCVVLSVVALGLATARPDVADRLAAMASERAQAAGSATEQPTPPAPACLSSLDAPPQTGAESEKDSVPVGFGWG